MPRFRHNAVRIPSNICLFFVRTGQEMSDANNNVVSPRSSKKLRTSLEEESRPFKDEDKVVEEPEEREEPEAEATKAKAKTSFKALGNVVLAMQRFKASLNPTYTYGKQTPSRSASPSLASTRSGGGTIYSTGGAEHGEMAQTSKLAHVDRGHRASLLLARLPDVPTREDEEGVMTPAK